MPILLKESEMIDFEDEEFKSASAGIITLLPYIEHYGIRKSIEQSGYPETKTINKRVPFCLLLH